MKVEDREMASRKLEEANARDPRTFQFGYLGCDDSAAAPVSMFFWFDTPSSLLSTYAECEPYVYMDPNDEDFGSTRMSVAGAVGAAAGRTTLSENLRAGLNRIMDGYVVVEWWGTFDDLCAGGGEWERRFRSSFREISQDIDDEATDSTLEGPITGGEMEEFIEYISGYGY